MIKEKLNDSAKMKCIKYFPLISVICFFHIVFAETDSLSVNKYVKSLNPYYQGEKISILPSKTAIILIDLWDKDAIHPLVNNKIIPLLKLAREEGITVIHAPSQAYDQMHPNIEVYPNDILITGYDDLGDLLKRRGINTILYAGYDMMRCVLDKPLGAINHHIRTNENYRYILIEDGVTSVYHETYLAGLNIFEKVFGYRTNISNIFAFSAGILGNISSVKQI